MNSPDVLEKKITAMTLKSLPPLSPPVEAIPIIEVAEDDDEVVEDIIESLKINQEEEVHTIEDIEVLKDDEPDEFPLTVVKDVPSYPDREDKND